MPRKTSPINDLNLENWRDYDDIVTDSLWRIPERDRSGAHLADYHGNFVPQIPDQAMRRYTKAGDVVIDPFLGSGTTLIQCRRMGRHGIGLELNPEMERLARARIRSEANPHKVKTLSSPADSSDTSKTPGIIGKKLKQLGREQAQLAILHPPYHSIIRFSESPSDLSNCPSVDEFLDGFGRVVDNVTPFLEDRRYLVLVIGDMYEKGEWIPLGFYCMQEVLKRGYRLKSIVVKDMQNNRAKRNLDNIWRYRALAGGFYIFKHEYIYYFEKLNRKGR
ncbi:MAG: DNA methyltransferase [Blastocatellales bacterium]